MIIHNVFENMIFKELKDYVETKSKYSPLLTKKLPQESKIFPIVPIKLMPYENRFNNLNYSEETYDFVIDINVYSIDKTVDGVKVSKRTICNEITEKIVEYFRNNLKVKIKVETDVYNIDTNVQRNNIKISGRLDTKYGENKLVIYPN